MTKDELLAENERLGAEVAALRELLTAVRDHADLPEPASYGHPNYELELWSRAGDIACWALMDEYATGKNAAAILRSRGEELRKRAARPLRYALKDALAAPVITDSERTCPAMNDGWHCHVKGDHGVHEDDNGDTWRTDGTCPAYHYGPDGTRLPCTLTHQYGSYGVADVSHMDADGTMFVVGHHAPAPATPAERFLLSVHGVNPDESANIRELRTHEAECTETDHTPCLAHLTGQDTAVTA